MMNMIETEFTPNALCWIQTKGGSKKIAVSEKEGNGIYLYEIGGKEPSKVIKTIHSKPVTLLVFNFPFQTVVSVDEGGIIEYWSSSTFSLPSDLLLFQFKSTTDLYYFPKVCSSLPFPFFFFFGKRTNFVV